MGKYKYTDDFRRKHILELKLEDGSITEDELIEENKEIMREAIQLYKDFLNYTVEKQWKKIFNASNTREVVKKDWLSSEWVKENVLNESAML